MNQVDDYSEFYRPNSFLLPVAKLLKSLILPSLTSSAKLAPHQYGFGKTHKSTETIFRYPNIICVTKKSG